MQPIETIDYRGFTINLYPDSDHDVEFALNDEPCALVCLDYQGRAHVAFDNIKGKMPGYNLLRLLHVGASAADFANELGIELRSTDKSPFGLLDDNGKARYFKSDSRRKSYIIREAGLESMRVELLRTNDSSHWFLVWDQNDLDKYAGVENAKPATASAQAWLDGEIYGYSIQGPDSDSTDDFEDSCWGYIGDSSYCIDDAKRVVDSKIARARKLQDKFCYYTDGKRIGYLQESYWYGFDLSTCHIPNSDSGTGFRLESECTLPITRELLLRGFAVCPEWHRGPLPEKWKDFETFKARGLYNSTLQQV